MAKKSVTHLATRDHLPMQLFAPGMTVLHRAGLGGLACTLNYIKKAHSQGALLDEEVPGGPWMDGREPWDVGEQSITLRFGRPENAREYLKRLFSVAFQICTFP